MLLSPHKMAASYTFVLQTPPPPAKFAGGGGGGARLFEHIAISHNIQ